MRSESARNPDHRSLCRYIGTAHPQRKAALLRICQPRRGDPPEDVRQLHDSMRNVPAPEGKILQIIPQNYIVDDEEETANPVGTFGNKLASTFNIIWRFGRDQPVGDGPQTGGYRSARAFPECDRFAEAVLTPDEKEEGVAVVDIGRGTTDVVVYQKNIIRHVGIIPMGGNVINKDIRSYGILEKHVENLKTRYGEAMRDAAQSDKYITTPGLSAKASKEISSQNLAAIIEARMSTSSTSWSRN